MPEITEGQSMAKMGFSLARGDGIVRVTVHAADRSKILHVDLTPEDASRLGMSMAAAAIQVSTDTADIKQKGTTP